MKTMSFIGFQKVASNAPGIVYSTDLINSLPDWYEHSDIINQCTIRIEQVLDGTNENLSVNIPADSTSMQPPQTMIFSFYQVLLQ